MENLNTNNNINIIEIIKKQKEELKNNRVCRYCGVKITCRNVCNKCTMTMANYRLQQLGYFKKYYEDNIKKPVEEQKKRGPKAKSKEDKTEDINEDETLAKRPRGRPRKQSV